MTDIIIKPEDQIWVKVRSDKGKSKYLHLLDGQARQLDIRDYDNTVAANFRGVLMALAKRHGLYARNVIIDEHTVLFQVTGKRQL